MMFAKKGFWVTGGYYFIEHELDVCKIETTNVALDKNGDSSLDRSIMEVVSAGTVRANPGIPPLLMGGKSHYMEKGYFVNEY